MKKHNEKYSEIFCSPSIIVLDKRENFKSILNHELMHLINRYVCQFNNEWNKLNKFGYFDENSKILHQGFVTKYGMINFQEDIATYYEELMMYTYSKKNLIQYNSIMRKKFKLLYKILIKFNNGFNEIIKNKIANSFNFQNYFNDREKVIVIPESFVSLEVQDYYQYNVFRTNTNWYYGWISGVTDLCSDYCTNIYNVPLDVKIYITNQKYKSIGNDWTNYYNNKTFGRIDVNRFKNNTLPDVD